MKYLENDVIRLRALEPKDIDLLYDWENDTSLWDRGNTLAPYSKYALEEYIRDARFDLFSVKQLRLIIELKNKENGAAGMIDLYDIDPHHSRAGVGILIDPKYQKRGIAFHALKILEAYAFEFLNLHQLFAYIPVENGVSLKLFEKLGYQSAGVLREWLFLNKRRIDVAVAQRRNPSTHQL